MSGVIGKIGSKTGTVDELDLSADYLLVKPHIIPDVLYPALVNVMVDGSTALSAVTTGPNGSTVTSSKYGTVQSDGRIYYYTDIKGSKPIKDPRIGAHFGSQRHKFKSIQLLEQETATHGTNIYSVDGREWIRRVGNNWTNYNNANGVWFSCSNSAAEDTNWIEITGYFNKANIISTIYSNTADNINLYIDGTDTGNNVSVDANVNSPLVDRYVPSGSVVNMERCNLMVSCITTQTSREASQ